MIIALALVTYLLAALGFARRWRESHPGWHWVPVFIASLGWPYLAALKAWAIVKRDFLGR